MAYGLDRRLPPQNTELSRRLALRWLRAATPHNEWAKTAKKCTDFLEGRQWPEEAKAALNEMRRSALTLNKIAPLYRLVMGYQSSNRMDVSYLPTSDSASSEDIALILNAINKAEANRIDLKYTDTEVFSDGLTTARGFWDTRLCFEDNDFGDEKIVSKDPFTIYIDPDADTYDLDKSAAYIQESVWTDLDAIHSAYGDEAAQIVENMSSPTYQSQLIYYMGEAEVSPKRYFGNYADDKAMGNWADVYHTDFVDRQAKRIRLLDTQYKITSIVPHFVDLETGVKAPIPEDWLKPENQWQIQKAMDYAQGRNNPLKIVRRPAKRVRWTVTCADAVLFDQWSPYETYTTTGYFPYFRRGTTKGMIEDLIDPQTEINKKRSILVDILNRNANSGWIYEDGTLDPEQEENLKKYGSAPGVHVKWTRKNDKNNPPSRLEPGGYPQGLDRLEEKAQADLTEISGINESALGQLDRVQSGRAIEARQRQAVLSIQLYTDNFGRSKKVLGRKSLNLYQQHYTEQRIYRIVGEDSKPIKYEINKLMQTGENAVTRLNDITVGKYSVNVDEVPISATFKQAQFEEMMALLEKLGPIGMALAQGSPDLIIDQTSLPRKDDWKRGLMQASSNAAMAAQAAGGVPPPGGGAPAIAPPTPEGVTG
jgi:hypothetical protein